MIVHVFSNNSESGSKFPFNLIITLNLIKTTIIKITANQTMIKSCSLSKYLDTLLKRFWNDKLAHNAINLR
jgi:hypothetical protein